MNGCLVGAPYFVGELSPKPKHEPSLQCHFSNRKIACLHDKPGQLSYTTVMNDLAAPGMSFDVNAQCRFVFGPSAKMCSFMVR